MTYPTALPTAVRSTAALAATLLTLAACGQDAGPVAVSTEAARATAASPLTSGDRLARALAGALARPELRAQLRNALRDSRVNEHKVVLQEFAATPAGERLLAAAAASAGVTPATLGEWMRQQPALDLYLPFLQDRQGWRGTGDLLVGFTSNVDDTRLTAYAADGSAVALDARDGRPARTLVLLHPAEPKWVRPARQEPSESGGNTITIMVETCEDNPDQPGCEEPQPSGYTLKALRPLVGDGWGDVEVEIEHWQNYAYSPRVKAWSYLTNANENQWSYPQVGTYVGINVSVEVWERDGGWEPTGDDDWGGAQLPNFGGTPTNHFVTPQGRCQVVHADWATDAYCFGSNHFMPTINLHYFF